MDLFERDLCVLSFEHGFSKPDPHVFRILTARLLAGGIRPGETLMVGDRLDNDILPEAAQEWEEDDDEPLPQGEIIQRLLGAIGISVSPSTVIA